VLEGDNHNAQHQDGHLHTRRIHRVSAAVRREDKVLAFWERGDRYKGGVEEG
jgi:hypothetical protein